MADKYVNTVFLDIGGVLLTNGWDHHSRGLAAEHFGFDYSQVEPLHRLWASTLETGSISLEQYLDYVIFDRPRTFTRQEFKSFIFDQSQELPDFLSWIKAWKRKSRIRIMALNNESREINDFRIQKFRLHECFDAFLSSCIVGFRKPDPRIFQLALQVAHAPPGQCYYFDDRPLLADAGRQSGMNAFQHRSFEETKSLLEEL